MPEGPEVRLLVDQLNSILKNTIMEELNINSGRYSKKSPDNYNEFISLLLGWKLVKFVKSNAIVFANHDKLLGVGAGQMSRIDSVKIAIRKSKENDLNLNGSIMASDAFFPFPDSVELAAGNGIVGVIQPGGSIKDNDIIKIANDLNLIMVFTRERHFYH